MTSTHTSCPIGLRTDSIPTNPEFESSYRNQRPFVLASKLIGWPAGHLWSSDQHLRTLPASPSSTVVFGMKTNYGGGASTEFCLVYDSQDAAKKIEPKHRLIKIGLTEAVTRYTAWAFNHWTPVQPPGSRRKILPVLETFSRWEKGPGIGISNPSRKPLLESTQSRLSSMRLRAWASDQSTREREAEWEIENAIELINEVNVVPRPTHSIDPPLPLSCSQYSFTCVPLNVIVWIEFLPILFTSGPHVSSARRRRTVKRSSVARARRSVFVSARNKHDCDCFFFDCVDAVMASCYHRLIARSNKWHPSYQTTGTAQYHCMAVFINTNKPDCHQFLKHFRKISKT